MWVVVRIKPVNIRVKDDQYMGTMLQGLDSCKSVRQGKVLGSAAAIVGEDRFQSSFNPSPLILHLLLRNNRTVIGVGHDHDLVLRLHLTYDFPRRCAHDVDDLPISTESTRVQGNRANKDAKTDGRLGILAEVYGGLADAVFFDDDVLRAERSHSGACAISHRKPHLLKIDVYTNGRLLNENGHSQ